ncbi:MAG: AAA family ATPase [Planctomycetota bacterium]|nr:AAA family ATPase [Planctomycetota bacterium]
MNDSIRDFQRDFQRLQEGLASVIVGHREVVRQSIICLVSSGHALIEGVPGLGKTLLARTLARLTDLVYSRIQFTPDLMPTDITGTLVLDEDAGGRRSFRFQKGPIFGGIVLADEINRATPKTQSALLEAMQERSVTIGGDTHALPEPFLVLATQNPIEMEGTYPLPEAQLDRFFFKVTIESIGEEELVEVLERTTGDAVAPPEPVVTADRILEMGRLAREIPIARHILEYVARLVLATHPSSPKAPEGVRRYVRFGASPRGAQAVTIGAKTSALARGEDHTSAEAIREAVFPALRHRILLNFEGEAEGVQTDALIREVIEHTPDVPQGVEDLLRTN